MEGAKEVTRREGEARDEGGPTRGWVALLLVSHGGTGMGTCGCVGTAALTRFPTCRRVCAAGQCKGAATAAEGSTSACSGNHESTH